MDHQRLKMMMNRLTVMRIAKILVCVLDAPQFSEACFFFLIDFFCCLATSKIPLEERIKNAIQNSFQKHKTTLSLKNVGMGPSLPLHICRLNYVVRFFPLRMVK